MLEILNSLMLEPTFLLLLSFLVLWDFVWKGIALYKAGKKKQKVWFFLIFILNTLGILPMLYIFVFSKK